MRRDPPRIGYRVFGLIGVEVRDKFTKYEYEQVGLWHVNPPITKFGRLEDGDAIKGTESVGEIGVTT